MSRQLTITEVEEVSEHFKSHYYNSPNKMVKSRQLTTITLSTINKMCRQWHVKTVDNDGSGGGK